MKKISRLLLNFSPLHYLLSWFAAPCYRILLVAGACLALVSCGHKGKLDGTYTSEVQSYTFEGDTVTVYIMGKKIGEHWPYTVEGKKVTLKGPHGEAELTINDDGSLSDPAKDRIVKK